MREFAARLRGKNTKEAKRWAMFVEQLCVATSSFVLVEAPADGDLFATAAHVPSALVLAGNPSGLDQLKRYLGVAVPGRDVTTESMGPDRFPCPADSPLH